MRFIIDTHILIWFLEGHASLSAENRQLIVDGDNDVLVSVASLWEIAIKVSLRKLELAASIPAIVEKITKEDIELVQISTLHIVHVSTLPFHHKDPFDRMIIAQALVETLPIISTDNDFKVYGVDLL